MRTPFPKYDAETVAAIEEYLFLDSATMPAGLRHETYVGLTFITYAGRDGTPNQPRRAHSRPAFEIFDDGIGSTFRTDSTGCPTCDDWARTWRKCDLHPPTRWDDKLKRWLRDSGEPSDPGPLPTVPWSVLAGVIGDFGPVDPPTPERRIEPHAPVTLTVEGETLAGRRSFFTLYVADHG